MRETIRNILQKDTFSREDIISLLDADGDGEKLLLRKSAGVREQYVGKKVWLRGLIEFSNVCVKNCFYCGIRKGNRNIKRYTLSDEEIITAAKYAYDRHYGSIALQSGETESEDFTQRVEILLKKIKELSNNELGVTLSAGEQEPEVYKRWFEAGAHRYLLRIETSSRQLYGKIHPADSRHDFEKRLRCLTNLRETGYMTGTGVMIGLPGQTIEDLADDLLFMQGLDIDMCGMGPYVEHADTPLNESGDKLLQPDKRLRLSIRMIAILRIMMKDINIVAATALQAVDPGGREKAVAAGANIIMPNITPAKYSDSYRLYNNKPSSDTEEYLEFRETTRSMGGYEIAYGEWGDSAHYSKRRNI